MANVIHEITSWSLISKEVTADHSVLFINWFIHLLFSVYFSIKKFIKWLINAWKKIVKCNTFYESSLLFVSLWLVMLTNKLIPLGLIYANDQPCALQIIPFPILCIFSEYVPYAPFPACTSVISKYRYILLSLFAWQWIMQWKWKPPLLWRQWHVYIADMNVWCGYVTSYWL